MISSLDKLFERITSEIQKGSKLINLKKILSSYRGRDWVKYAKLSKECYKRTLINRDLFVEIILIGWNINQKSPIHDHPKNGCLVKILKGTLNETIYSNTLKELNSRKLQINEISYQESNKILHKIENLTDTPVYSLHVYAPPNYKSKHYSKGCYLKD